MGPPAAASKGAAGAAAKGSSSLLTASEARPPPRSPSGSKKSISSSIAGGSKRPSKMLEASEVEPWGSLGEPTEQDPFACDEEAVGGILKSLISTQGIQSAWQRTGKRLQVAEAGLRAATERLNDLPNEFVVKAEYEAEAKRQEEKIQKVVSVGGAFEVHLVTAKKDSERLEKCVARLDELERWRSESEPVLSFAAEGQQQVKGTLEAMRGGVEGSAASMNAEFTALRAMLERQNAEMQAVFQEAERTRYSFTETVVNQVLHDLGNGVMAAADGSAADDAGSKSRSGSKSRVPSKSSASASAAAAGDEAPPPEGASGEADAEKAAVAQDSGLSPAQLGLLSFLEAKVASELRRKSDGLEKRAGELAEELMKAREELARDVRILEKTTMDTHIRIKQTTDLLQDDVKKCTSKAEFGNFSGAMRVTVGDLGADLKKLSESVDSRLGVVGGRLDSAGSAIDFHEKRLRAQGLEIQNRATKVDLNDCKTQMANCVRKTEFTKESQEVRAVLDWQSDKIEGFGLTISMLNSGGKMKGKKSMGAVVKSALSKKSGGGLKTASRAQSRVDTRTEATSPAVHSSPSPKFVEELEGADPAAASSSAAGGAAGAATRSLIVDASAATLSTAADEDELRARMASMASTSVLLEDDEGAGVATVSDLTRSEIDRALTRSLRDPEDEHTFVEDADADEETGDLDEEDEEADVEDEEEEEESSDDDIGGTSLFKQQLEALSMGLVGLGHLALREPKIGLGREARLRREKEMLEELMNLRHWVSNRTAPSGWDPKKLTTVALSCSHPREDEHKRPMPSLALKGLMQEERRNNPYSQSRPPRAISDGEPGNAASTSSLHSGRGGYSGGYTATAYGEASVSASAAAFRGAGVAAPGPPPLAPLVPPGPGALASAPAPAPLSARAKPSAPGAALPSPRGRPGASAVLGAGLPVPPMAPMTARGLREPAPPPGPLGFGGLASGAGGGGHHLAGTVLPPLGAAPAGAPLVA